MEISECPGGIDEPMIERATARVTLGLPPETYLDFEAMQLIARGRG